MSVSSCQRISASLDDVYSVVKGDSSNALILHLLLFAIIWVDVQRGTTLLRRRALYPNMHVVSTRLPDDVLFTDDNLLLHGEYWNRVKKAKFVVNTFTIKSRLSQTESHRLT